MDDAVVAFADGIEDGVRKRPVPARKRFAVDALAAAVGEMMDADSPAGVIRISGGDHVDIRPVGRGGRRLER
jgi:hypothetical protein